MTKHIEQERRLKAVALKYEREKSDSPTVIAKGNGKIAQNILEHAKEHEVPIQYDPSLIEVLSKLDINESIPEELYSAVAEIFAYVYQIDKRIGK